MKDACDRIDLLWFAIFLSAIGVFVKVVLT